MENNVDDMDSRNIVEGRDVTERHKAQEEKQKSEARPAQARKMEAIGRLAGGIAHDFNNILTAITGYGEIARMELPDQDPVQAVVADIIGAAERGANLTRSLLAFSREQVTKPEEIDLNDIVRKTLGILKRIIGEDIALTTSLCPGPLHVFTDVMQVEQILMNLAANARDAMPDGGSLLIKTDRKCVGDDCSAFVHGISGDYAVVTVSDTGCGMDERIRARIFDPFFTTKEAGKGTGLGLSTVGGIVKRNNGWIDVESEFGKGASFTIYLLLVKSLQQRSPAVGAKARGGTETILVAEDNEEVRAVTLDVLSGAGYFVIPAVDGVDAMEKILSSPARIDLALLDVIMPKKSGLQVYQEMRRWKPGVKALFSSGYPEDLIREKGIYAAGLHFIEKPFTGRKLLNKIRSVLDSGKR